MQDKPYALADKMSKLIPFEVGMTLAKAIDQEEQLVTLLAEDVAAQEIWDMAVLEGLTRMRVSTRAAWLSLPLN